MVQVQVPVTTPSQKVTELVDSIKMYCAEKDADWLAVDLLFSSTDFAAGHVNLDIWATCRQRHATRRNATARNTTTRNEMRRDETHRDATTRNSGLPCPSHNLTCRRSACETAASRIRPALRHPAADVMLVYGAKSCLLLFILTYMQSASIEYVKPLVPTRLEGGYYPGGMPANLVAAAS